MDVRVSYDDTRNKGRCLYCAAEYYLSGSDALRFDLYCCLSHEEQGFGELSKKEKIKALTNYAIRQLDYSQNTGFDDEDRLSCWRDARETIKRMEREVIE